jgi:hypothetical protein
LVRDARLTRWRFDLHRHTVVEFNCAAHGARVAVQATLPEAVAHHGDVAAFVGLRIQAAGGCRHAQDIEKIGAGGEGPDELAVRSRTPPGVAEPFLKGQVLEHSGIAQFPVAAVGNLRIHARQAIG